MSADIANISSKNEKRVFVIFGSPHKNGNTAILMDTFLKNLKDKMIVDFVSAFESGILPCIDCGYCKSENGCAFEDFDDFDEKYRNADIIVIATPVYNLTFPGPLKGIFDRTQQYYNTQVIHGVRPSIKKPKKAVLLLTCGNESDEGEKIIEKQLKLMFSVMNTELTATVLWKGTDKKAEKYAPLALEEAELTSNEFLKD